MNAIGLDIGTTTISASVVDAENGNVLEIVNVANDASLPPRRPGEHIQDADRIAARALEIAARLKAKYPIHAIGLDGQMHGMLYISAEGRAISPLYTWQDGRSEESLDGSTYADRLSERLGRSLATGYGLVTHFWHQCNDAIPKGAAGFCTIADYVGMALTHRAAPLVHASNAASMGIQDRGALARAGFDGGFMPETIEGCTLLGTDADGIPVACAIGDNQASFLGSVRDMEGTALINMGTGGQISMLAQGIQAGGNLEKRPLIDGADLLAGSSLCGGRAYALLERFLRSCAGAGTRGDVPPMYEAMNGLALQHLNDADLPMVDTRFHGMRTDPGLRGSIGGITPDNFDAGHLIAGTVLGMARELFGFYEEMLCAGARPASFLVGSGNGLRRNLALRRAFEMTFGLPMQIPAHIEEAAFGAALYAMAAAGLKPSLQAAQRLIRYIQ